MLFGFTFTEIIVKPATVEKRLKKIGHPDEIEKKKHFIPVK
jgi:hypothetical protein